MVDQQACQVQQGESEQPAEQPVPPPLQQQQGPRPRRQASQPQWLADSHQETQRPEPQLAASNTVQQEPAASSAVQQQPPRAPRLTRQRAEQDAARHIRDLIKSDSFWSRLQLFHDVCYPLVLLMRLADSNVPCMGKLYHRFYMLSRFAEAAASDVDAITEVEEAFNAQVLFAFAHLYLACALLPFLCLIACLLVHQPVPCL